jgi:CheY-like chemotaxis protein
MAAQETARAARPRRAESSGRHIVLVEDNPVNRKLVRNVLHSQGHHVLEAQNGEDALALLRQCPADLVLMDIQLPGMDGLEVTRRLRSDPRTCALPVVALTAHAQEADEQRAREAGCVGYITKPIHLSSFTGQLEAYFEPPFAA